jgi:hypothetical protein
MVCSSHLHHPSERRIGFVKVHEIRYKTFYKYKNLHRTNFSNTRLVLLPSPLHDTGEVLGLEGRHGIGRSLLHLPVSDGWPLEPVPQRGDTPLGSVGPDVVPEQNPTALHLKVV